MVDTFIDYRKNGSSIYLPPPITHMVPSFNTITYAIAIEKQDVTILSRLENGDVDPANESSLALKGYTIAPHLAISLKKVGIGFSIENSKNTATYDYHPGAYPTYSSRQTTTVSASGLGFNLSALPFEKLRKENKLAVILGGKSLNVRHEYTDIVPYNLGVTSETVNVRYTVLRYQAGANLTLALLKQFRVIPWIDYGMTDTKGAEAAIGEKNANASSAAIFADDLRVFWKPYPNLRYGIDMSIGVFGLDIRIGSFLGSLARLNSTPDFIQDKTFSLSLSFDQKGG